METLLIIFATGLLGYSLSDDKIFENREIKDVPPKEIRNGISIYQGNQVGKAFDNELKQANELYRLANEPGARVLLPITNSPAGHRETLGALGAPGGTDEFSAPGAPGASTSVDREQSFYTPSTTGEITKIGETKVGNSRRASVDATVEKALPGVEDTSKFAYYDPGYTGPEMKPHTNMKPFFGSSVKQSVIPDAHQETFDNFTGVDTRPERQELAPFAKPNFKDPNLERAAATTQIDLDRTQLSRFKQNEKPFEPQRVAAPITGTPGPISDAARYTKNIDELRPLSNQKGLYKGTVLPGQRGDIAGVLGKFISRTKLGNRNTGTTPGGYIISQKLNENVDAKETERQKRDSSYHGIAKGALGEITPGAFAISEKNVYSIDHDGNARSQIPKRGIENTTAPGQERDTYKVGMHSLNPSAPIGKMADLKNADKTTLKQTVLYSNNGSGNTRQLVGRQGVRNVKVSNTLKSLLNRKQTGNAFQGKGAGYVISEPELRYVNKSGVTGYTPGGGNANFTVGENQQGSVQVKQDSIAKDIDYFFGAAGRTKGVNSSHFGAVSVKRVLPTENRNDLLRKTQSE